MNHAWIHFRNRMISLFPWVTRITETRRLLSAAGQWRTTGWTSPPPFFVRRAMLLAEARAIGAEVFVETGTFLGDTTWAFRNVFRSIHTIEVEPSLADLARKRFSKHPHIEVIEGDSSRVLGGLCGRIDGPCLFYLDGHYSGGITGMGNVECPILAEIDAIFERTRSPFRIVVDDARLFGSDPAYPTLEVFLRHVQGHDPSFEMRVENDAILLMGKPGDS